jgi:hypothetical protein
MLGRQGQATSSATRSVRSGHGIFNRIAVVSIAAFLLAACQVPQGGTHGSQARLNPALPPDSGVPQASAAPSPGIQSTLAQPGAVQPAVVKLSPTDRAAPAALIPAATRGDATIGSAHLTGDPKELVGLDNMAVRHALGDPLWIRKEQPAQVWQYATADCIVDLYLYEENGGLKVTFIEARSHKAEAEPTARCLKSLLERPTASAN